mmetsp:Transcript_625/g.1688  ORF Transcript_625/g.1688 Transcript_625/m.1688 type:complete len:561 (+) Transcript_625:32-1714(+)
MGNAESGEARVPIIEVSDDGLEAGFRTDAHDEANLQAIAAAAALGMSPPAIANSSTNMASIGPPTMLDRDQLNTYRLEPTVLGEGAFGKVRLATSTNGHQVAVKTIKRDKLAVRTETLLTREVKHHELLRQENIVRLYTWIKTPTKYYLVMEYCPKGDLLGYIEKKGALPDAEAKSLFGQLLRGVAFCHSLGIHHRDLKLENLMLVDPPNPASTRTPPAPLDECASAEGATADGAIVEGPPSSDYILKIADFGLSELRPVGLSGTYCGSPLYAAPELMHRERREASPEGYDASKSDMWSCGVIHYAILTASLPFDSDDLPALVRMIVSAVPREPIPESRGTDAATLCTALLQTEPDDRLTAAAALDHAWLSEPVSERSVIRVAQTFAALASVDPVADVASVDDPLDVPQVRRATSMSMTGRRGASQTTAFFRRLLESERCIEAVSEVAPEAEAPGGAAAKPASSTPAENANEVEVTPGAAPPVPTPSPPAAPPTSAAPAANEEASEEELSKAEKRREYALRKLGLMGGGPESGEGGQSAKEASTTAPDVDSSSAYYSMVS